MVATERCCNCGALAGPAYCGACGQKLRELRGPFYGMVRDALAEFFALDGALARTLRALAVPGKLTREFLAGRRAAYLRPVRLYAIASLPLFSSVLSLRTPDAASVNFYIDDELVIPAPAIRGGTSYTIDTEKSRLLRLVLGDSWNDLDHLRGRPAQELLDAILDGLRRILPQGRRPGRAVLVPAAGGPPAIHGHGHPATLTLD